MILQVRLKHIESFDSRLLQSLLKNRLRLICIRPFGGVFERSFPRGFQWYFFVQPVLVNHYDHIWPIFPPESFLHQNLFCTIFSWCLKDNMKLANRGTAWTCGHVPNRVDKLKSHLHLGRQLVQFPPWVAVKKGTRNPVHHGETFGSYCNLAPEKNTLMFWKCHESIYLFLFFDKISWGNPSRVATNAGNPLKLRPFFIE